MIEEYLIEQPTFETKRLVLRSLCIDDVDDIFEFSSDPEVAHHMTWEVNTNKSETLLFINSVLEGYKAGVSADWAIVEKISQKVIGMCSFVDWSNEHSNAVLGYVINQSYWGNGYAAEAANELLKYGFQTLQLHRIEAHCDIDNLASEKVMKKLGMSFEGLLRQNQYIKGAFRDTKIYGILQEDYSSAREKITSAF